MIKDTKKMNEAILWQTSEEKSSENTPLKPVEFNGSIYIYMFYFKNFNFS